MNVFIPIATGQTVNRIVIDSIKTQTINPSVIICDSPGEINSDHNHTLAAITGEMVSRNMCIDKFLQTKDKYFFNQCRGVKHLRDNNLEKMFEFMDNNPKYGACTLKELGSTKDHIVMGILCMKREILENGFRFVNRYRRCLCAEVKEDILSLGYEYGYIGNEITISSLKL